MCGTNARSQAKLVNGDSVGTGYCGSGNVSLQVNQSRHTHDSNFAISKLVMWDRGLTRGEMYDASDYLMHKFLYPGVSQHAGLFKCPSEVAVAQFSVETFCNVIPHLDGSSRV